MEKSLLFIPDISGFTEFVQSTEVAHSQHVISELLEVLIDANTLELQLAEIEGDALFFYKELEIPSLEKLLAQVETMYTAFYGQLKLLEKNRICPCHACSTAHTLQLKIIAHCGELQFISVKDKRKPFGTEVIQAHRLLKNSVDSDNYVLLSNDITENIKLSNNYQSMLFDFKEGNNEYDGQVLSYLYSIINKQELKLKPFSQAKKIKFDKPPAIVVAKDFSVSAPTLLEYITNYSYRYNWVDGVDKFEYNANEVTRLGTEHVCVINDKHLNFITVTKQGKAGQVVYGELTTSPKQVDELYQFYVITPLTENTCKLEVEIYWIEKSPIKRLLLALIAKNIFKKNTTKALEKLSLFINSKSENNK